MYRCHYNCTSRRIQCTPTCQPVTCRPCCCPAYCICCCRKKTTTPVPSTGTVTYNSNGGTGGTTENNVVLGADYTIKNDENTNVSRTGYTFTGWNTAADQSGTAYQPGDVTNLSGNLTLYAQWTHVWGWFCWFDKGNELLQIIWGSAFDRRQTPDRLYDLPGFSFTFSFRTLQRKTYLCSSLLPLCFSYIAQGGFWYRTFIYGMIEGSFIPVTGSMFRWQTAMGGKTMCMMPVCLNRLYVSEVSEAGFLLPSIERYQLTFS